MTLKKAVFLDRDGVLNKAIVKNNKPYPPANLSELEIADEVLPALQSLKNAGYLTIVVTNQPDVARGTTEKTAVEIINQHLQTQLPIDDCYVCYHDDKDNCDCRKPFPGLLLEAAKKHNIDLAKSFMIGDRWKDISAGQSAGCKAVWLDCGYDEKYPENPDFKTQSLAKAVEWIVTKNWVVK